METIEVHSKNFVIRWVHASSNTKVTWSVSPTKRSINFGVFATSSELSQQNVHGTSGPLIGRLEAAGYESLVQGGLIRIETKEQSDGAVVVERSCMIGFVFDNTFSISNSKLVRFSFNVEPLPHNGVGDATVTASTGFPESAGSQNLAAAAASSALYSRVPEGKTHRKESLSSAFGSPLLRTSTGSLQRRLSMNTPRDLQPLNTNVGKRKSSMLMSPSSASIHSVKKGTFSENPSGDDDAASAVILNFSNDPQADPMMSLDGRYVTGYLQKKRRKQFQGFARRYFSFDKKTGLLSYYLNNKSSSLRGVMPIRMSQIKCDMSKSIIYLDSGMEKWALKSHDPKAFETWVAELREVHNASRPDESEVESEEESPAMPSSPAESSAVYNSSREGTPQVEPQSKSSKLSSKLDALKSKVSQVTDDNERADLEALYADLVKAFNKDSKQKPAPTTNFRSRRPLTRASQSELTITTSRSLSPTMWQSAQRQLRSRNFLVVAAAATMLGAISGFFQTVILLSSLVAATIAGLVQFTDRELPRSYAESVDETSSMEVPTSRDVAELSKVEAANSDEDFNDSDEADEEASVMESKVDISYVPQHPSYDSAALNQISEQYARDAKQSNGKTEDPSVSEKFEELAEAHHAEAVNQESSAATAPAQDANQTAETSLYPLPHAPVKRRNQIPEPTQPPPSIMSLLKNARAGNTAAPITSNEPLSALQSLAEGFEHADLLGAASKAPAKSHLRVMLVAVFAVSRISSLRCKERVHRKPFTPLLGETYEVVREDLEFRFVSEKVKHKPVIMATQVESPHWTVHFTSRPHSKMWAKSMQLSDVGTFNVTFPDGESVFFANPEMFVRNIVAGERYIEPHGSMLVESSADPQITANVEFKAGGMFSGRSEEVKITSGKLVYEGKWTEAIYHGSDVVWSVKPLVENPTKHYGFTVFGSELNEITDIEKEQLPPNDSRLRPDLLLYEKQTDVAKSEEMKLALEQAQRDRRKKLEDERKLHEPFFFIKSQDAKGSYVLRHGERNYWVQREQKNWKSIPNYFEL